MLPFKNRLFSKFALLGKIKDFFVHYRFPFENIIPVDKAKKKTCNGRKKINFNKQMEFGKKSNSKISLSLFICMSLLCGCGYSMQGSSNSAEALLISIPLIQEDDDGILRSCLARSISETGKYRYTSNKSLNELIVTFEKEYVDTIGYEWDVNAATGINLERLYPDEGRKTVIATVTLLDSRTKQPIIEPFKVSAQVNYDFVNPVALNDIEFKDMWGRKQTTLQYSLGQLDSEEGARSASQEPLYQELAKKITEGLRRSPPIKRERNERN